jgi:NAD(P)-dependent dehydrogenase (short-subunit alcohol dehydrogenase family)
VSGELQGLLTLVTGATRGIGAAVAKRYASEGAHVIAVGRSKSALEALDDEIRFLGGSCTLVQLDLTQPDAIETLATTLLQRYGKLDVLVGNAGVLGEITPMPHTSASEWDRVIATNLSANFHLIRCFDGLLKASPAGRAIFVTSGVAVRTAPYWGAYSVSKTALETMVKNYAAEHTKTSLRINLIDPGAARTRMRAQAFPGEDPDTLTPPEAITDRFVELASPRCTATGERFFAFNNAT